MLARVLALILAGAGLSCLAGADGLTLALLLTFGSASSIIKTVTGTAPLLLANAVSHAILSLTQTGKCVQSSTPTPSAPVDIVCNNGKLTMVDDDLPSGYTRLSYIESDGTSGSSGSNGYVDTGIILNSLDLDVEIDFQLTDTYAPSPRMAWGYMGTPSSLPRWGFGAYSGKWLGSPNATASAGALDTDRHVAVMRVYTGGSNAAFYNGTLDGETLYNANNLGNVSIFEDNDTWPVYLFARNNNNTAANFAACKIFRFKVTKANVLTHDLVPCKDDGGALGFYDLKTGTFLPGSGTLTAGAADYSHAHIGAVGTPEVLTVGGKNLNGGTIENKGYTSTGGESTSTTFAGTLWKIPCKEGDKFTVSWGGFPDGVSGVFINTWLLNGEWNARQAISASTSLTYTVGAGVGIINFTLYKTGGITIGDNAWLQVEYGSTATEYEPYVAPQTASVVNLLAVGDYADTQEVIIGAVNRKIGIYVFDGTETWIDGNYGYITEAVQDQSGETYTPLCTHFRGTTGTPQANSNTFRCYRTSGGVGRIYVAPNRTTYDTKEAFAAFIAAQYAAGTPVIVLYPLAEETTETVTGQALHTSDGDNVVSVTSNVDPVSLTAEYKATE